MPITDPRTQRTLLVAAGIVCLAIMGAWGLSSWTTESDATDTTATLPEELSVKSLEGKSSDPGTLMEHLRNTVQRDALTEEQHRALRANVRKAMHAHMKKRSDEYVDAGESERQAVLDRHLDEMQAQMKAMRQHRASWERANRVQANGGTGGSDTAGPRPGDMPRPPPGGGFGQLTQQERKARSESRSPDEMARAMAYFTAMRKRAKERGIELPTGPPGPGGPPPPGGGPPG